MGDNVRRISKDCNLQVALSCLEFMCPLAILAGHTAGTNGQKQSVLLRISDETCIHDVRSYAVLVDSYSRTS